MKELKHCPACASEEIKFLFATRRDLHGNTWRLARCATCSHGFVNPQPEWGELKPYYSDEYASYSPVHNRNVNEDVVISRARQTGILRHAPISEGTRLLDVGCGGGGFLQTASKLGARVKGVEPSEYGASQARQLGIDVFCGTVKEYEGAVSGETFDVITMSHVLEHVPEPVKTLEAVRRLLADDGVVVLGLPNGDYWAWKVMRENWIGYQVPVHLMHFSLKSLTRCVDRSGLLVESMRTQSEPHAVATTLRGFLSCRLLVPRRISKHLRFIDRPLAVVLAKRWDAKQKGEALVAHLKASNS